MFVGKLIRAVGGVVEGVAEGVLGGATVLVKGGVKTITGTAEVLADGVDRALSSVNAEIKAAVSEAKKAKAGQAEGDKEQGE